MKTTSTNDINILKKTYCCFDCGRRSNSLKIIFILFLSLITGNINAQNLDQRAENIQNGTFNLFMSADQSYYYGNTNRNNDPYGYGYWVVAHTLETLADAYQRTRNTVYKNRMKSIIAGIRKYNLYGAGTYHNDYYDDLEWLCLANFDCYNATRDPEFLDAVHQIWAEIKTGYANGKMSWKKGCTTPCNNAIANSPAVIIAVKLYQLEGDNANLQMAKDIHAWIKANLLNADGGIWDGPGNTNPDWQFSYNSGMFIGACLELSLVTGQQSYIDDGIKASEFMMNFRNYNGGVFFLNETGQGDGGLFKGIFAKWFTEFVRVGNLSQQYKDRYLRVINYTADYAWANSVNKSSYLIGPNWSALPSGTIDLSTQTSGVHLFEAAASLNKVHVYQDINYAGFYSQFAIGSYTLAQLQARGMNDNDITSLTIPDGYSVTVYENDNFAGASKTFTSNTAWLADWNDRISSLKISDNRTYFVNAFQDINYGGYSGGLDVGNYTLAQLQARGISDNDITSFKISPGFKVTVYDGDNFTGTSADYTADVNWLADWNDKISSLKVIDIRPYPITVYQDVNYGGYAVGLDVGDYTLMQLQAKGISNNDITSLKVAAGYKVTIFDNDNFTGASIDYTSDIGWTADWNDRATSVRVSVVGIEGTGDGLSANYFNGMNFETLRYSTKDANLNFNWGNSSPNAAVNVDQFSARWTGQIQPRYSGDYTFYINSDNGRRVWINNQLVIDKWIDDWNVDYTGTITLTAGQKYDIKVEYFENNGGAGIKFEWSSAQQAREVVPTSQLYSNPLPTITLSSSATIATAPANLTLNATANDANGIAKVDFYNGTTLLGSDNTSPYSYAWSNVGAGSYNVTALATDSKGGVTLSSAITIAVNAITNNAPTVTITAPSNNTSYNAPASITFTVNAADSDGSVTKVEYFNGTTSIGSATTSPYSFTWNNVAAGDYSITAKAIDNGGATTVSAAISIKINPVTVNKAPTVSIISPSNNASYNAPASITFTANATDTDGSVSKVEYFNGTTSIGSSTSSPYSVTWNNVAAGDYSITAKATDNGGATTVSAAISIKVNPVTVNKAPTVSITSPSNNTSYNAPASITFTANAADSDGSVTKVEYFNGATSIGSATTSLYSFTWNNVAAGDYSITAKATDNAGATTVSSVISVKVISVTGNKVPTVNITAPSNNATYNAPASITINANANDEDGTISKVDFYNGNTLLGSDNFSPFSITWNNVGAGTYIITAKATDNSGATTTSSSISVKVNSVVTNACSGVSQYVENGGYAAGSIVQNAGSKYQCKPWPYSGWCNGAAWAYAPGTGSYWGDAWTLVSPCNAKMSTSFVDYNSLLSPNPTSGLIHIELKTPYEVTIFNSMGEEVMKTNMNESGSFDISNQAPGVYLIRIDTGSESITKTIIKNQ